MGVVAPARVRARHEPSRAQVLPAGPAPGDARWRYVPGLDGLRAIALLAVMAFHHQFPAARGGYLGVSSFFTLSGFLITTLAIDERRRTGRLSWQGFWERRARRLLPASVVALAGVLVLHAWLAVGAGPRLRGDVLSALGYVTNWRLALTDGGYADLFSAPSPVVHFWSLAIEEQFYLVFPLAFAALAALARGRPHRAAAVVALGAATSFAAAGLWAARSGNDGIAYYGTHTRASELLVGVALAFVLEAAARRRRRRAGGPRGAWAVAGVVGLAGLAVLWTRVPIGDARLFRGVTAANALLTAVVIVAAVRAPVFSRALGVGPLRAVGRISYGAYLFHWPLYLVLTDERTGLTARPLFAVRLAATLTAAAVSAVLVERPVRVGLPLPRPRLASLAAAGAAVVVVLAYVLPERPAPYADLAAAVAPGSPEPGTSPISNAHQIGAVTPPDGPADAGTVMLAGDSVAWSLLAGFDLWARAHPDHTLQVDSLTAFGCPLGGRGRYRIVDEQVTFPDCAAFADTASSDLAEHAPDAVVFLMGLGNLNGREIDGEWRDLGDPVHDRWLAGRVDDLAARFEAAGVPVLWLTFPHVRLVDTADPTRPWQDIPVNDPARVERYNALVRDALADHDGVEVIDLAGWLETWPDASFDPADRDGVHFSFEAAGRVVEWLAPMLLTRLGIEPPADPEVPDAPPTVPS